MSKQNLKLKLKRKKILKGMRTPVLVFEGDRPLRRPFLTTLTLLVMIACTLFTFGRFIWGLLS